MSLQVRVKPSYWVCGAGGINCSEWDDINGCWCGYTDFITCPVTHEYDEEEYDGEYDDEYKKEDI